MLEDSAYPARTNATISRSCTLQTPFIILPSRIFGYGCLILCYCSTGADSMKTGDSLSSPSFSLLKKVLVIRGRNQLIMAGLLERERSIDSQISIDSCKPHRTSFLIQLGIVWHIYRHLFRPMLLLNKPPLSVQIPIPLPTITPAPLAPPHPPHSSTPPNT